MKGLLIKDFLVLTKQMKLFLIIIPFIAITGGTSIASIGILLGAMLPMTAMAYDEQSKWNNLAIMMPYSRKDIILSKYVLGYLGMGCTFILFLLAQIIINTIHPINIDEIIYMILFTIISGLLFISINIPIAFKYGTQKGRIVFIIFIGVISAAGTIFIDIIPTIPENIISVFPTIGIIIGLLLNVISIFLSLHINNLEN